MGGSTKTTQTTSQTSERDPWAPTVGPLQEIIDQLQGRIGATGLTAAEQGALDRLGASAVEGNPYAPQIAGLASDLLGGGPDHSGRVNATLDELRESLLPIARGEGLDIAASPAYQRVASDVTNRVNGLFAGAGRDLSGAHLQTLARGIAEGTAPLYEAERNRQVAAIDRLHDAGQGATGLLSSLGQTALANRQAGVGAATAALQARDAGATQTLAAEAMRRNLPLENVGAIANLLVPLAQLGGTAQSQGITTGERREPLLQQITGAVGALGNLGRSGAFGPGGWLMSGLGSLGGSLGSLGGGLGALGAGSASGLGAAAGAAMPQVAAMLPWLALSDARAKEDVQEVGALYDGSPVYRFRYRGEPATQIGLIAQDVEQRNPGAVAEIGGLKAVDYAKATEEAEALGAAMGGRAGADEAAADGFDAKDIVSSAASGLAEGLVGLAGLPGDAIDVGTQALDSLAGTRTHEGFGRAAGAHAGSEALRAHLERLTGPLHAPQTRAGRYAQTIAGFAPLAIGGPQGLAARLVTRALIPGAASEAAGQATEGSEAEPVARAAGAVAGFAAPKALRAVRRGLLGRLGPRGGGSSRGVLRM